jgi:hypothetical protein
MTLPTKLYHYCGEPIEKLYDTWIEYLFSIEYLSEEAKETVSKDPSVLYNMTGLFKPYGFWFSVEHYADDHNWKDWCEEAEFCLESLKLRYLINLKKEAQILVLSNPEELMEFSINYASNESTDFCKFRKEQYSKYSSLLKEDSILRNMDKPYVYQINWKEVQDKYDGIIITPYQWSCRLMNPTTSWYYGWDCASGCIWNTKCIEIELDTEYTHELPQLENKSL